MMGSGNPYHYPNTVIRHIFLTPLLSMETIIVECWCTLYAMFDMIIQGNDHLPISIFICYTHYYGNLTMRISCSAIPPFSSVDKVAVAMMPTTLYISGITWSHTQLCEVKVYTVAKILFIKMFLSMTQGWTLSLHIHMHIATCIHILTHMHLHTYTQTIHYVHTCICIQTHALAYTHTDTHVLVNAYTDTCVLAYAHVDIHVLTYTNIHTQTHMLLMNLYIIIWL